MPGMDISDGELAALAGRGDAEAYRHLFERYQHPVYNFVYRMVDNAEDAADIVQNAFIKLYTVIGQKEIENFSAYLYRTAKNLAYDEMRRRSRFADVDHEVLAPEDPNIYADPQRALLLGEQLDTVRGAVARLNENQRAALILRELQDLDYDEMSVVLDSNRNAVGALLSRARLKLREELRMAHVPTQQLPADCEECIALLSPYIDGELKDDQKGRVEAHLDDCTFCMAALEEMREASRSLRMFIPVIPPADVAQAFTGRMAEMSGQAGQGPGDAGTGEGTGDAGQGTGAEGQGGGEPPLDATMVYPKAAPAGRSFFSRMLHSWVAWMILAASVLLVAAMLLLAEETVRDRNLNDGGAVGTTRKEEVRPRTTDNGAVTPTTVTPTPAPDTGTDTTDTTTTPTATATTGTRTQPSGSATPLSMVSGRINPNPASQYKTISYSVFVKGQPQSVEVSRVHADSGSAVTVPLTRQTGSGDGETWVGTETVYNYGTFYVYSTARNAGGDSSSLYVGSVFVYATIN